MQGRPGRQPQAVARDFRDRPDSSAVLFPLEERFYNGSGRSREAGLGSVCETRLDSHPGKNGVAVSPTRREAALYPPEICWVLDPRQGLEAGVVIKPGAVRILVPRGCRSWLECERPSFSKASRAAVEEWTCSARSSLWARDAPSSAPRTRNTRGHSSRLLQRLSCRSSSGLD